MLTVKTYLAQSKIHGIGLFAGEAIAPGAVVWQPGFEVIYTPEEFSFLPERQKDFILVWGWQDKLDGNHHISLDHDRFMNHSFEPNTRVEKNGLTVAARFIFEGEEILCNYAEFEAEFRFAESFDE